MRSARSGLLQQRDPVGYLREASALGEAESLEAVGEHAAAMIVYERLSRERPVALDEVLMRLGHEAEAVGDETRAIEAYARVFYEFPLSEVAPLAKARLDGFPNFQRLGPDTQRYKLELGRAQRLFGAKQYGPARAAFEALRSSASGDDRELVNLRIAESDYYLKKHRAARDGVRAIHRPRDRARRKRCSFSPSRAARSAIRPPISSPSVASSTGSPISRGPKKPSTTWPRSHILSDDDDAADALFRELCDRYPKGVHTERAAWKVGWRAFREGRYDDTTQLFERAAFDFPRSDYRPAWLFWAGRAHELNREDELAEARYSLAAADYLNTYYGRLAVERLKGRMPAPRVIADRTTPVPPPPPNDQVVRALLEIARYDDALNELKYGLRNWSESSAAIQATMAWIYRQQGLAATGREQFNLLRGSINTMRRAYPQFMAAGGEYLPREVLSIIFPMSYWDLIQKHAAANGLDPYFVAALVAQESTFVPDIQSPARAVGLMQLMPPTARAYARKLGLPYSPRLLTNPEANIRMGTAYLADKVREFGDLHLALASYNAGERAVRRWLADRPGVPDRSVHRRHPVSRNPELREAHSRDGGRLPAALQRPEARAAGHRLGRRRDRQSGAGCQPGCRAGESRGAGRGRARRQHHRRNVPSPRSRPLRRRPPRNAPRSDTSPPVSEHRIDSCPNSPDRRRRRSSPNRSSVR